MEIIESKALEQLTKARKKVEPVVERKVEPAAVPPPARPEPKKPMDRAALSDFKPKLYPEGIAVPDRGELPWPQLLLLLAIIYHFSSKKTARPGGGIDAGG